MALNPLRAHLSHFHVTAFHHLFERFDVFDWLPTQRTNVIALLNPAHDTVGVEVVAWVTLKLSQFLILFVLTQTDTALFVEGKPGGVEWGTRKPRNNSVDLVLVKASLPLVILDSWDDLTKERLDKEWERLKDIPKNHWDHTRLLMDHWVGRIRNLTHAFDSKDYEKSFDSP